VSAKEEVSRHIPDQVKHELIAISGGRCEFCNQFLFVHKLTKEAGYFGNLAHIIAFSLLGPRADDRLDRATLNEVANLMLLCPECHKLVDDNPESYTVEKLTVSFPPAGGHPG